MNYMIKPLFIRRYKKHGLQALNYYKDTLDISKPQFLHTLDVLYGYLKSAFRTGMALKHLRTPKQVTASNCSVTAARTVDSQE